MRLLFFSIVVVLITETFVAFGEYVKSAIPLIQPVSGKWKSGSNTVQWDTAEDPKETKVLLTGDPCTIVSPNDCSRTILGRQNTGVIKSYNFPFDYSSNLTCSYRIYLDVAPNTTKTICFTFYRFSLETSSPYCSFDYLSIGIPTALKYCGAGLWQYGLEDRRTPLSNIWSNNLCWSVNITGFFDVVFVSDNSISGAGFFAKFVVFDSSGVAGPAAPGAESTPSVGVAPCQRGDAWTCFNRRCIAKSLLCNGQDDCGDGSDETYAHARCRGQNILACDFSGIGSGQNFCEMTHVGWRMSTGLEYHGTRLVDHTNGSGGSFLYTNESTSRVISPQMTLNSTSSYCLTFWYYIVGESSTLAVFVAPEQAYSRPEWSHGLRKGEWTMGEVYVDQRSSIQVIFSADHGGGGGSVGFVGIDDISLLDGDCSGVDVSCNFESGFCGWSSVSQLSHKGGILQSSEQWSTQRQGATMWDHSSVDGYGYYLFVELPAASDMSEKRAIFLSPAISAGEGKRKCLTFWYIVESATGGRDCRLSVAFLWFDNALTVDAWNQSVNGTDAWQQARIDVQADGPFQIVLMTVKRSVASCQVFLDEIALDDNQCGSKGVVGCTASEFLCPDGQCISRSLLCDQIPHCTDGSDESMSAGCPRSSSTAPTTTTTTTGVNLCNDSTSMFRCENGLSCIPRNYICDGVDDCSDSSDELTFAGCPPDVPGFPVSTTATSLSSSLSSSSSLTTRSSSGCITDEFRCTDGICLVAGKQCDGREDCSDGLDERKCPAAKQRLLSAGAIAGISVGCLFVVFLLVLSVALFSIKHHRKQRKAPIQSHSSVDVSSDFTTQSLNQVSETPATTESRNSSESLELPYNAPAPRPTPVCGSADGARLQTLPPFTQNSTVAPPAGQKNPPNEGISANVQGLNLSMDVNAATCTTSDSPEGEESLEDRSGFPHNRHFYRSLPPIPSSPPNISPLLEALLENQRRRQHRPPSSTPSSRDLSVVSEHIYEEPVYGSSSIGTGLVVPTRNVAPVHSRSFHLPPPPPLEPFRSDFRGVVEGGVPSARQTHPIPADQCDMEPSNMICVTAFPVSRFPQPSMKPSVAFCPPGGNTRHRAPSRPTGIPPVQFFQAGIPEVPDVPVEFNTAPNSRLWKEVDQDSVPFPVMLPVTPVARPACGISDDGSWTQPGETGDWSTSNGFHSRMGSTESSGNRSSSPLVPSDVDLDLDSLPSGTAV